MKLSNLSACALAVLWGALLASNVSAQDFHLEEFSNDQDASFEPDTRDPINEPDFDGLPPVDWNDIRNGWSGVIEENLSPVGDVGYPPADPGATTTQYAVIQHEAGTGPYWSPSSFDADCATLTYAIDVYADPVIPSNGVSPDFWWTNAVGPGYVTESGLTADANGNGTWTFATTGGGPIATVPVGSWYEMEVTFTQGSDSTLDVIHTLYDATGTIPLGSFTVTSPFLNPPNALMTPAYSWFTFFGSNVDVIFVDDFTVECLPIPEPTTLAMLGMGMFGLVAVARRRRRVA